MRLLLACALVPLVACHQNYGIIYDDGGVDSDTDVALDLSRYDGARLRIVEPASGAFLPWGEVHGFTAVLTDAQGVPIDEPLAIDWTSDVDTAWAPPETAAFDDATLDVGVHALTAEAVLPNGDRVAHTIGGVLVQSIYAGTWTGLFSADVNTGTVPVACSGAATLVVEPYGKKATGNAACRVSLGGFDLDLAYLFDLDNDAGALSGTASADIFGLFQADFPANGGIDPNAGTLDLAFTGAIATVAIDGGVDANRISRDAGL